MKKFLNFAVLGLLGLALLLGYSNRGWTASDKEEELFFIAQKAFDDGFYDVAIRYIDQFKQDYPRSIRHVQIQLLLGQCYFFKKQYLKAYDIFQDLLAYPDFKDATLYWLGETYFKGADYKQARNTYQQLIDVYPDSQYLPQAYYSLAWTYYEEGNYEQARTRFVQLMKNFPEHALVEDALFKLAECEYNLGRADMASQYFRNYILKYPKSTRHAKAYFYIAESHYYIEDYPAAITYYAKVADIAYDHNLILMATISMGWSYLKLDKYDLSQQYFDQALALSKKYNIPSDDIYLGQASLYAKMQDYTKARTAYGEMINKFPDSPRSDEAYLGKANMDYNLEHYREAIRGYQKIIDRFKDKPHYQETIQKAYYGLAWTHLKMGDISTAILNFKKILDQTDSDIVKVSVLTQIGDAYHDNGNLAKALETYDQVLKQYPDSHYSDYVQYREGIALLKLEKIDAATLSLQSLQANYPGSQYLNDTRYYLGLAFFKKKNWQQSLYYFSEYLQGLPRKPEFVSEAKFLKALSYFYLEDFQAALDTLRAITTEYPQTDPLYPRAQFYMAKSFDSLGKHKEAIRIFKSIPELFPASSMAADALIWLGDHYLKTADFDKAVQVYTKFLDMYPGSDQVPLVQFEIGQAYQVQGQFDQALNYYKLIHPDHKKIHTKARLAIADIFSQQSDPATALNAYQDIIVTAPEFKRDAYIEIARIHQQAQKFDQAITAYQQALESDMALSQITDAQLLFALGDILELTNNTAKAVDTYLKIPYLHPSETSWVIKAYLRTARIYEDQAQWEYAMNIYNKVMKYQTEETKYARERLDWIRENMLSTNPN